MNTENDERGNDMKKSTEYKKLVAITKKCAKRSKRQGGVNEIRSMQLEMMKLEQIIMNRYNINHAKLLGNVVTDAY